MRNPSVLIVAEQEELRDTLASACLEVGLRAVLSPDGLHAVTVAFPDPPEFMIIDQTIGGVDPITLLRLISQGQPNRILSNHFDD